MLEISGITWAVTIGLVVGLLAVDLCLAAARPHRVGFKEAVAWSVFYIAVAVAFGGWFAWAHGGEFGLQYFAGYVVEKSLSVDNLFVFVIIMTTFAAPEEHQHKVLWSGRRAGSCRSLATTSTASWLYARAGPAAAAW